MGSKHDTVATKADLMRAALRVAELEEDLVACKKDGSVTRKLKNELREARRTYRELRDAA